MAGMTGVLAFGLLLSLASVDSAFAGEPSALPEDGACPIGESIGPPAFPVDMLRKGASAVVPLVLTVDPCGRVINAVAEGTASQSFKDAALASVQGRMLNPAQLAEVRDGTYRLQITFQKPLDIIPSKPDWPKSHRRPHYLVDTTSLGYESIEAADAAIRAPEGMYWNSPYPGRGSRFVQQGGKGAREFWLFMGKGIPTVAVRYLPVIESGEPVVRVAIMCDEEPDECAQIESMLMEGLPFAKARKK